MNLILVGLSGRDELAFDLFLKRFMPSWHWRGMSVSKGQSLPGADILIVDLTACGWSQRSDGNYAALKQVVGSGVAVLLVSAHDVTWSSATPTDQPGCWVWLDKPYNAESMRVALTRAQTLISAASGSPARSGTSFAKRPKVANSTELSNDVPSIAEPGLAPVELSKRLSHLPSHQHVMLRKLDTALRSQLPFEVRYTIQHGLIVHPPEGWVASNTPKSVVLRVCASDALAASVTVRELAPSQVEERLHQLGMTPHDLNEFLLEVFAASVPSWQTHSAPS
jgi:hypothetical protein